MAFRPLTARAPAVLLREAKPLKAILGHAQNTAMQTATVGPGAPTAPAVTHYGRRRRRRMRR